MKFFSSVFAVSLLVASALTIDAGTTTQVSDNCDTGFSQTGERSSTNGKQGVPIAKSGFSLAGRATPGTTSPSLVPARLMDKDPGIGPGQKVDKPVFFKLNRVVSSTLSGFNLINMPYRTFSIGNSNYTTITASCLTPVLPDDCLAMQSSTNTLFSDNYCCGSHGISIGSLGGPEQNSSTTVDGLTVTGNTIVNSTNGIRIKTIIGLKGLVTNAVYTNNELLNVTHAIITNITIDGLTGTAANLYDIVANPDVVSNWDFKNVDVVVSSNGNCTGEPSNIQC
ncbi:Pectin lyase fold [Phytophthora cactorum]|nr:Pectin lyase fold [Phytophthora cactorum]